MSSNLWILLRSLHNLKHLVVFSILLSEVTKADVLNNGMNEELHERLTTKKNYSPFVRPVKTHDSAVLLFMNLSLIQILDVVRHSHKSNILKDEKRQIIITNAWVNLDWKDHNFTWDPMEHGNVTAGGDWDLASSSSTLVVVNYDGTVVWRPPIIFKSQCEINVEYFPFDMQNCSMKIGCWTHHGLLIDLRHTSQRARSQAPFDNCRSQIDHAMDLSMFTTDVQWDLIGVSARRNIEFYPCCTEPYLDITFYIILRRKPLFFGVNVICPCISISILTILVFYLPADSREKISLSMSILIALTVFFLLVFEISPPTSLVVPLIGKFLLFTMVLIIFSTIATVVVLNVRTRSPDTHKISPWIRRIFIDTFPKILFIKRYEHFDTYSFQKRLKSPNNNRRFNSIQTFTNGNINILAGLSPEQLERSLDKVRETILYFRQQEEWNKIRSEWKYVAFVIDRLLLWIFIGTTAIGIMCTFVHAPMLYVNARALTATTAHAVDAVNVTRLSCETKLT
ncbi:nicotinic acetylcholine receptor a11 subunit [Echinococcus multilocularis]|uniref:Nicotinic acetylcholine receptor a11 subunit n=1 Tax=Echinococcus multilocularis TaxID=6211 RepID=A0A068YH90_ECHMU|nr:nicotinic acetylcholine receptor a11 subunit [Echinococcus multilocularis]